MNTTKRILIVEDEPKLAGVLMDYLARAGYATDWLADGLGVAARIAAAPPDLVLLDLMLPGRDGMDVCRDIRKTSNVPIFMVTARIEEIDRLLGLELGADDYICKPYSPREVVARVRALFRRLETLGAATPPPAYRVDREKMLIAFHGAALELTTVEFRLLAILMETPGRIYSREQLLNRLYEDRRVVTDRTIDTHIKNIRRKLAQAIGEREALVSVYGVGYKFEWS
ncbi:two-component system, OmpR family, response regulator BaeR [Methylomagnum ishizawai]|uniref:Two-component system, OmpR family, response regulator BaeR n=1 Tax=Methylomagnum ishizawai TaxID=1760988 RepID=A0A1Y6DAJ4_9GAMM|nr:response regulator [Methylomagnum ishizawai]SMF96685.1 two-component system, OmpR family, response regulator BaeR [Methylomagnum ishizawai]